MISTNDGDTDLLVTYWGPNLLYRNNGDSTFDEIAAQAGVDHPGWGTSAAFADLDGDGWLDLYVTNYLHIDLDHLPKDGQPCQYKGLAVPCGPQGFQPKPMCSTATEATAPSPI